MSASGRLRVRDYLGHIAAAIERINRYVKDEGQVAFAQDEKTQDAVIRNIEIIGEAARNVERVAPEYAAAHPEIPWPVIYAMRNRVTHGYFEVDLNLVWQTVQTDLPLLEKQIRALINSMEQPGSENASASDEPTSDREST